jgi:hypothetical protein
MPGKTDGASLGCVAIEFPIISRKGRDEARVSRMAAVARRAAAAGRSSAFSSRKDLAPARLYADSRERRGSAKAKGLLRGIESGDCP